MEPTSTTTATATTAPVKIPDEATARVYADALKAAAGWGRRRPALRAELVDAATDGVMWALSRCTDATTFEAFARRAVKTFLWRRTEKAKQKRERNPEFVPLTFDIATRKALQSARLTLNPDLPEDLAFALRLYAIDGFTMREIGLLTGASPNTVDQRLKRAAKLLHDGPSVAPARRSGEKRLSAG